MGVRNIQSSFNREVVVKIWYKKSYFDGGDRGEVWECIGVWCTKVVSRVRLWKSITQEFLNIFSMRREMELK